MRIRPDWDDYFIGISRAVAARADCTRRQVGAVIVDEDHRILATGYNGSPPGGASCLMGECPRGRHYKQADRWCHVHGKTTCSCALFRCACGEEWPCNQAATPGSSYDTGAGGCISVHAEANALLFARASVKGATLYCTDIPCDGCSRLIQGAGIARVVTPESLMEMRKDERDPKFVDTNASMGPVDEEPICERRGCGHFIGRHDFDFRSLTHSRCLAGCGCTEPLKHQQ